MRAAALLCAASATLIFSTSRATQYEIASCDDFSAVDDELATRLIITSDEIACDEYTRLRIRNSTVITASSGDTVTFKNFALKVLGDLTMEPNVVFQDVVESTEQGGALSVQINASTIFKGTAHFQDLSVMDISSDGEVVTRRGGAIHNKGNLVFEGDASFLRCEAKGLNDASEGGAGAVSNRAEGEIVFKGKLTMEENKADGPTITLGGGIFNRGHIIVEGESYFRGNSAGQGGAIAQRGSAEIILNSFVTFLENSCTQRGGAIFNSKDSDVELNAGVLFEGNIAASPSISTEIGGGLFTSGGVVTFVGSTTFRSNIGYFGGAIAIVNGDSDEDADDDSLEDLLTPDDDGSGDPPVIIYPEDPSDLVFNNNLARVCPDIYPDCLD